MNCYTAAEIDAMGAEDIGAIAAELTDEAHKIWAESGYSGEVYATLGMNDAEREINRRSR